MPADPAPATAEPRDVYTFFGLTFAISWALWLPMLALQRYRLTPLLGLAGTFGPLAAAAICTWRRHGHLRPLLHPLLRWRIDWVWYLLVLLLPVAAVVAVAGVARALGAGGDADPLGWQAFPSALLLSVVVGGGQEEPGWRGFAQPGLQPQHGALRASLLVGVAWALWHLPLFAIPGATQTELGLSFWVYLLYVPALSVLFAWLYNATGGSVLLCVLFHGALNAATVAGYPLGDLAGQLVLAAAAWGAALLVTVWFGPARLGAPER